MLTKISDTIYMDIESIDFVETFLVADGKTETLVSFKSSMATVLLDQKDSATLIRIIDSYTTDQCNVAKDIEQTASFEWQVNR